MEFKIKNPFKKANNNLDKKSFKMWSAFTILLFIIAMIILLSWILKWTGATTSVEVITGYDPSTGLPNKSEIQQKDIVALGIFDLFLAPINGFVDSAGIIIFLVVLGAFLNVVICSRSLEGFSQSITAKLKGKEIWAIIPLMFFFSLVGSAEGMAEESLGFYMICIPLMIAAGYDKLTGFLIVLLGAGVGVMNSTVNPFSIGVAVESLNGSNPVTSIGDGLIWRIVCWFIMTTSAVIFVMYYSWKVKMNPQKSIVFSTMEEDKKFFLKESSEKVIMDWRKITTLVIFFLTFILMIFYLVGWDQIFGFEENQGPFYKFGEWIKNNIPYLSSQTSGFGHGGFVEVGAIFFVSTIILGLINGLGEDKFINQFMDGAKDLFGVCLVIAVASGIGWALKASLIQNLVVNGLANSIGNINSSIGIILILFILFLPLSFVIPSTSGFAKAVFPLLGGVVAKDPEVLASGSITAFSFACGLLNIITPTSGVVMGALAVAKLDYGKFLKVIWPIIAILIVLSIVLLSIGGAIGGNIA